MAISKIENCSDLLSLVTYVDKLKSIIKKDLSLSFEEFAVLTYINDTDEEEYHLTTIINKLNHKQPQMVRAVKNLAPQDYFTKRRNEDDERTVFSSVNKKQRKSTADVIAKLDKEISKTDRND